MTTGSPPSSEDENHQRTVAAALTRLQSLGNPGAVLIPRGRLRRPLIGWAVGPVDEQGDVDVYLLPTGVLVRGRRVRKVGKLTPTERVFVGARIAQLGNVF